jgi:hypothetical protein
MAQELRRPFIGVHYGKPYARFGKMQSHAFGKLHLSKSDPSPRENQVEYCREENGNGRRLAVSDHKHRHGENEVQGSRL